jgi:hypothetical protein
MFAPAGENGAYMALQRTVTMFTGQVIEILETPESMMLD